MSTRMEWNLYYDAIYKVCNDILTSEQMLEQDNYNNKFYLNKLIEEHDRLNDYLKVARSKGFFKTVDNIDVLNYIKRDFINFRF